MGKNCARKGNSFSHTDRPSPVNNIFFSCGKLILQITNGFVYITQLLSLNRLARRLLTICKKSWQRPNNSDSR